MIIACISAYQDRCWVGGTIESLRGKVDRIIVVDGAYKGFPLYGETGASTDGTPEMAKILGAEVIRCDGIWEDQTEKRNQYFIGGEDDWYLSIDSDERLKGTIVIDDADSYRIKVNDIPFLRLIKHREGLRYEGTHSALFDNNGYIDPAEAPIMRSCEIEHLRMYRDDDRKQRKQVYYGLQYDQEQEFKAKHKIP